MPIFEPLILGKARTQGLFESCASPSFSFNPPGLMPGQENNTLPPNTLPYPLQDRVCAELGGHGGRCAATCAKLEGPVGQAEKQGTTLVVLLPSLVDDILLYIYIEVEGSIPRSSVRHECAPEKTTRGTKAVCLCMIQPFIISVFHCFSESWIRMFFQVSGFFFRNPAEHFAGLRSGTIFRPKEDPGMVRAAKNVWCKKLCIRNWLQELFGVQF